MKNLNKKELERKILKTASSLALTFAIGSLSEASTIFTHQPEVNEALKSKLKEAFKNKR